MFPSSPEKICRQLDTVVKLNYPSKNSMGSHLGCGLAMSHNLAGVNPALVIASHGPSI